MSNRKSFFAPGGLLFVVLIVPIGLAVWWAMTSYPRAVQLVGLGGLCWVVLCAVVWTGDWLRSRS